MNIYAAHGFAEFVVALGYRGEVIKDYFPNFHRRASDLTIQLRTGEVTVHAARGRGLDGAPGRHRARRRRRAGASARGRGSSATRRS